MVRGERIGEAGLADWRKLAQGLHARYLTPGFGAGARFVAAVAEAGDELGHHPRVSIGRGHVDLELVTDEAVYRDDDGTEYVVEWVTQQDVDLARRITEIAAGHALDADPASVSEIELGLESEQRFVDVELVAPFSRHDLVDRFHTLGRVEETVYDERGTILTGKLPEAVLGGFDPYLSVKAEPVEPESLGDRGAVA